MDRLWTVAAQEEGLGIEWTVMGSLVLRKLCAIRMINARRYLTAGGRCRLVQAIRATRLPWPLPRAWGSDEATCLDIVAQWRNRCKSAFVTMNVMREM